MEGSFVGGEKYLEWVTINYGSQVAFAALWEMIGVLYKHAKARTEGKI